MHGRDYLKQRLDLSGARHHPTIHPLRNLRSRPLDLVDGIVVEQAALDGIAKCVVQDGPFATGGRGGSRKTV
jgi:hypothetical protein